MRVNFIYHKIPHHSDHSGYDQLVKHIRNEAPNFLAARFRKWVSRLNPQRQARIAGKVPLTWYSRERLLDEAEAAGSFLTTTRQIYHCLYGENLYYYLSKCPNWGRNRRVVTYHQPPSYFPKAVLRTDHLHKLDAVIAVSRNQMEYFQQLIGIDRVFYVPHGVDTAFFQPPETRKMGDRKRCLFVGHWLRDMEGLANVIRILEERKRYPVQFTIVTFEKYFDHFKGLESVELISGIPEDALLNLYRTCDALFLPLLDCTANNTILEAMACGLPIVTTDAGGIRDYLDDKSAAFVPTGDAEAAVEVLTNLLWEPDRMADLSKNARQRALEFDWPIVAAKTVDIYKKIL